MKINIQLKDSVEPSEPSEETYWKNQRNWLKPTEETDWTKDPTKYVKIDKNFKLK